LEPITRRGSHSGIMKEKSEFRPRPSDATIPAPDGRVTLNGTVCGIKHEMPHDGSLRFKDASFIRLRDVASPALWSNTMRYR
jgi:hypothetical protein